MNPSMTVVEMLTLYLAHVANLLATHVENMTVGPGLDALSTLHSDLAHQHMLAVAYCETRGHLDSILGEPEHLRTSVIALNELDEDLVAEAFRVTRQGGLVWIEDRLKELRAGNLNVVQLGLGGPAAPPVVLDWDGSKIS